MTDQGKMNKQKRTLGHSGIGIAPLVFGGNVLGWTADKQRSFELLDHFVARGFNTIDTADDPFNPDIEPPAYAEAHHALGTPLQAHDAPRAVGGEAARQ